MDEMCACICMDACVGALIDVYAWMDDYVDECMSG